MKAGIKIVSFREQRRKKRIHAKIIGIDKKPRLVIFRSNRFINAQLVSDESNKTILGVDEKSLKIKNTNKKTDKAKIVGQKIAEIALKKGITTVVFDRNGYKYHGRVKSLAEGAREKGLKF